jgi:hypothetical protein
MSGDIQTPPPEPSDAPKPIPPVADAEAKLRVDRGTAGHAWDGDFREPVGGRYPPVGDRRRV